MKTYFIFTFLMISVIGFSNSYPTIDTISNWQVYNDDILLKAMNFYNQNERIILRKGKIRSVDNLRIVYSDDTPCFDCSASITIKTEKDKTIRTIDNSKSNNDFEIKTTDLQVLAFKNRSQVLKFYYKEDTNDYEIFLFELEIK